MKYYEYEENNSSKIPYDKEPIYRQTNYKKPKASSGKNSTLLSIVLSVVILINIILGFLVFNIMAENKKVVTENTTNINIVGSQTSVDMSAVASKSKLSVVCVNAGLKNENFFDMKSMGSGVIFKDNKDAGEAYILTCYHVVRGYSTQIYVKLYDSMLPMQGTLVNYSSVYDIAVIKIKDAEYTKSQARPASVADSSLVIEGESSLAVGNALGADISVTNGIISRTVDLVKVDDIVNRVIRTDAPINSGNSGGGLFNAKGELIGIVNAKVNDIPTENAYVDNVAYAIPSNVALGIANNILRNDMPVKAILGATFSVNIENDNSTAITFDIIDGKYIPIQSVMVIDVENGLNLKNNDIITGFSYGDTVVNMINIYTFDEHAFNLNVGDTVIFFIERDGETMTKEVVINKVLSADYKDWYISYYEDGYKS